MTTMIISALVALVFLIAAGWAVSRYNALVYLKNLLDEAWSGISVQLKRRYDLIPNIVATVKGYATHEKGVLERVAELRAASMNATTVQEKSQAEGNLTQALKTLFAVVENYPDLKANSGFLALQKELSDIEHHLQLSRRYYNGVARDYNTAVQTLPTSLIAGMLGFSKAAYFELEHDDERRAPKVEF